MTKQNYIMISKIKPISYNKIQKLKDELFEEFLSEYKLQIEKVKSVLDYLHTYEIIYKFIDKSLVTSKQLENHQKDWIYQHAQFNETAEKGFFKSYWIPLNISGFDYFLDLSDNNLPVYKMEHDFIKARGYYKYTLIPDIGDFMCLLSDREKTGNMEIDNEYYGDDYFIFSPNLPYNHLPDNEPAVYKNKELCLGKEQKITVMPGKIEGKGFKPTIVTLIDFQAIIEIKEMELVDDDLVLLDLFDDHRALLHRITNKFDPFEKFNFSKLMFTFKDYPDSYFLYSGGAFTFKHYNKKAIEYLVKKLKENNFEVYNSET